MSTLFHKAPANRSLALLVKTFELLAILFAIAWFAAPPPILVTLGARQTVLSRHPKVGVHTRLTDEVEVWKIKKTLEMVREMGAPWIVEYFPWDYIEHEKGQFDWSHADAVVDHARAQGLRVIARLGFVPEWARPKSSVTSWLDSDHYGDWANFVAEFAAHFNGRVGHIIVWNEPNTNFEWGERPVDPNAYTNLLRITYLRVKQSNPGMKILAGALAPNLAESGSGETMSDLEYLRRMYAAGAKDYFDTLAVHAYGWKSPAEQEPAANTVNFRRTELLRDIMLSNGDGAKQVMITEGGWNDHPRWTKAVSPAERIQNTLRAYDWCEKTEWVDACALWVFRYPAPTYTFNDYWTFVTPDFAPKPIYFEVQKYATISQ